MTKPSTYIHHLCERCLSKETRHLCQAVCEAYQNSIERMRREREKRKTTGYPDPKSPDQ